MTTDTYSYSRLSTRKKKKTPVIEIILFTLMGVMLVAGGMALYSQFAPSQQILPATIAEGFKRDRINILLIGVGGDAHPGQGKELADSLMLVSLKPSTKQAAMTSIPRDFLVPASRYGEHRINAAHDIGNKGGYPGRGPGLVSDEITQITGQPVDAFIRVDFKAFEKLIDTLGGVDIYVYRPFHDQLFKQTFRAGWQHMDGKRALAFARYRYVLGAEGTTHARDLRQQQIVSAVRQKLQNLTPAQIARLMSQATAFSRYATTNLTPGEIAQLYRAFHDMPQAKIRHVSLAPFSRGYSVKGEWAVVPRDRSGNAIRQALATVFAGTKPIANYDQIQLVEGVKPEPALYAGDDTMVPPERLRKPIRKILK